MSVILFSMEEFQELYSRIMGLPLDFSRDSRELAVTLKAAFLANRAAFYMTYSREPIKAEVFDFEETLTPNDGYHVVWERIGSLFYNCVSNGGRDFLPEKDRSLLNQIRLQIADLSLRELDRRAKNQKPDED